MALSSGIPGCWLDTPLYVHEGFVKGLISSRLASYPRCGFGFHLDNLSHWVLAMAAAQVGHLRSSDRCDHRKGPHGGNQRGGARCYPTVGCPGMKRDAWESPINPGNGKIIYWWIVFYCHVWGCWWSRSQSSGSRIFPERVAWFQGRQRGEGDLESRTFIFLKPTFTLGSRVPPMSLEMAFYIENIEIWHHFPNIADASKWLMHWPSPFSPKKKSFRHSGGK